MQTKQESFEEAFWGCPLCGWFQANNFPVVQGFLGCGGHAIGFTFNTLLVSFLGLVCVGCGLLVNCIVVVCIFIFV